ncbi:hypothetical protein ACHAPT_006632 [Fusarium lateritium]
MSSSADKNSLLFWLQYGDAIRNKVGVTPGGNKIFFLASEAQKGPLAGNDIPNEYTAQGLYDIANNLLSTGNVTYSPSALHGYDQALDSFLNWVDLGGKANPALDSAYLEALKDQAAYQVGYYRERKQASGQWAEDKKLGLTKLSFIDYVNSGKTPGFSAATQSLAAIGSKVQQIQLQQGGPMAATVNDDRARLGKGRNLENDYPGFNVHGAIGDLLSTAELTRAYIANKKIPRPDFQRIPLYGADAYKKFVQDAMERATSSDFNPAANSIDVSIDTSKSASDYNFGQTQGGASIGGNIDGWISFSAGGSHSSESSTLQTGSDGSGISVQITYDDIQAITITPGSWDIDVSKYKLRSDAPQEVKTLARVSQIIAISAIGFKIILDSAAASALDQKLKETTSAGGSISVFGIPISLGGSGSHTDENQTHEASWDSASKTFTVTPIIDNNCATVVGVVGEGFNML